MKNTFKLISEDALLNAVELHKKDLVDNPDKVAICDDTITPFARAMKSLGYSAVLNNRASKLRVCINDECKEPYSTLYLKDGVNYWGCPHCKRISED